MNIISINGNNATIQFAYKEIYTLLQCAAETRDYRSDGDVEAIIGTTKSELSILTDKLANLKNMMDSSSS
jgi:hypothetical protein